MSHTTPPIYLLMVTTPLKQFLTNQHVIGERLVVVSHNATVPEAFKLLTKHSILSAPVVNSLGTFVGVVSLQNIVFHSLDLFESPLRPLRFSDSYLVKKRQFKTTLISEIMEVKGRLSSSLSASCVNVSFSLFHAFEILAKSKKRTLTVVDDEEMVVGFLTQSMFIRWFEANSQHLGQLGKCTNAEIRKYKQVAYLPDTRRAISAFEAMRKDTISSVAVTDPVSGELKGAITMRDLRGISPESLTFRFLWNDIRFFKEQIREQFKKTPEAPVCITGSETTLKSILDLMEHHRVHQIFVVKSSKDKTPVDIISQTDILTFISEYLKSTHVATSAYAKKGKEVVEKGV